MLLGHSVQRPMHVLPDQEPKDPPLCREPWPGSPGPSLSPSTPTSDVGRSFLKPEPSFHLGAMAQSPGGHHPIAELV